YDHGKERLKSSALGYTIKDDKVVRQEGSSMMIPFSAGALYSTTHDLLTWNTALHSGKVFKKPETLAAMIKPNLGRYAYGFIVTTEPKARRRSSHGGAIEGLLSEAACCPPQKLLLSVLVNNYRVRAADVIRSLTAIYDGEKVALPKKRGAVEVDSKILAQYV